MAGDNLQVCKGFNLLKSYIPTFILTEYWPVWLRLRQDAFTCVELQVPLFHPIWQVTLHKSVMGFI